MESRLSDKAVSSRFGPTNLLHNRYIRCMLFSDRPNQSRYGNRRGQHFGDVNCPIGYGLVGAFTSQQINFLFKIR